MGSHEMIIDAPPFELEREFTGQLGDAPRTPGEWSETTPQGEIDAFDEGGLNTTGETDGLEPGGEDLKRTTEHLTLNVQQTAAAVDLLDLGREQAGEGAPDSFGLTLGLEPMPEVSSQDVEIEFEAIAAEGGQVCRG